MTKNVGRSEMKILIEESVLRQALEAFGDCIDYWVSTSRTEYEDAMVSQYQKVLTSLRTAIDAAENVEPVAWMYQCYRTGFIGGPRWFDELSPTPPPDDQDEIEFRNATPLYTHPAPSYDATKWQLVPKFPDWKNDPQALKFLERINRGGLCCGTEPVPEFIEKAIRDWQFMLSAAPKMSEDV